jgi:hypothetical protein
MTDSQLALTASVLRKLGVAIWGFRVCQPCMMR